MDATFNYERRVLMNSAFNYWEVNPEEDPPRDKGLKAPIQSDIIGLVWGLGSERNLHWW